MLLPLVTIHSLKFPRASSLLTQHQNKSLQEHTCPTVKLLSSTNTSICSHLLVPTLYNMATRPSSVKPSKLTHAEPVSLENLVVQSLILIKLTSTPTLTAKSVLKLPQLDGMLLTQMPSSLTGMFPASKLVSNALTSPDGLRSSNPTALLLITLYLLTKSHNASTLQSRFQSQPLSLLHSQDSIAPSHKMLTHGLVTLVPTTENA